MNHEASGHEAVLGLDTATEATAVATLVAGRVLAEIHEAPEPGERPRHAETLLPAIEEAVASAGGWDRIGRIAVGTGPGAFTGLRIGIATATALAASVDIQAVGVSTLDGLAAGGLSVGEPLAALVDARRGEVFAASYRATDTGPELLRGPLACPPGEVAAALGIEGDGVRAVGSGAVRYREELGRIGLDVPLPTETVHQVSAAHIAALGERVTDLAGHAPEPIYIRPPDAQRWRERDAGTHQSSSRT